MRVVAGGPTRETESRVFRAHVEGLEAQVVKGWDVEVRHERTPDPGGPRWTADKIERVARVRQQFLDERPDALLLVDTDVVLGPGVLARLMAVDAPVVYGVFWTVSDWGGSWAPWPQVWDVSPYGWTQETADALRAPGVNEVPVLGGGAVTLIRWRGFESRYWPLLESLRRLPGMWGGEDRAFGLGCECRGLKQVAVTGLPIRHCYTLADQTRPALNRIKQELGL